MREKWDQEKLECVAIQINSITWAFLGENYTLLPAKNKDADQPVLWHSLICIFDRERSGSVVECLTRDRRAAGSSLTGVTALCP